MLRMLVLAVMVVAANSIAGFHKQHKQNLTRSKGCWASRMICSQAVFSKKFNAFDKNMPENFSEHPFGEHTRFSCLHPFSGKPVLRMKPMWALQTVSSHWDPLFFPWYSYRGIQVAWMWIFSDLTHLCICDFSHCWSVKMKWLLSMKEDPWSSIGIRFFSHIQNHNSLK